MPEDKLSALLKKYADGTCTDEERKLVERLYEENNDPKQEQKITHNQQDNMYNNIIQKLQEQGEPAEEVYIRQLNIGRWVAAASILLFVAVGGSIWLKYNKKEPGAAPKIAAIAYKNDIAPGRNKATLTLADGSVIVLNDVKKGELARQGAANIIKLDDGRLAYNAAHDNDTAPMLNTISTPLGGQYQIILPDGTHVWLNAGSSLQFPVAFTGDQRNVTLKGEAYFEVAKNKRKPFIVAANNVNVQVLGTHFNVMAYGNEPSVKTTLLEGSVMVTTPRSSGLLHPNQMADVAAGGDIVQVREADIDKEMAWKNNLFWFNSADIHYIMKQVARWYDVDIKYEGTVSKEFSGTLPRNLSAIKLLKMLEQTGGVHFKIDGRIITVMP
ncbi:FecR family protein [Mucilaginibacter terrigena]|uniref:FecR family protein n=1 Tax=Mucilaginibacter terrigena TaxID=2492395 RepID=A0A4Q5LRJ6_9SPHI|nr:FecR family protein [Mucilaginibacter terrigena]RYU92122.1 FecR family protein [Mucilaginibacter terrigena]